MIINAAMHVGITLVPLAPLVAAKIFRLNGDLPLFPLILEMCCTYFGIKLSRRFSASAAGEEECLTMFSRHSLFVFTPNFGSPMIAVKKKERLC